MSLDIHIYVVVKILTQNVVVSELYNGVCEFGGKCTDGTALQWLVVLYIICKFGLQISSTLLANFS
jgi:hypothetical protein